VLIELKVAYDNFDNKRRYDDDDDELIVLHFTIFALYRKKERL